MERLGNPRSVSSSLLQEFFDEGKSVDPIKGLTLGSINIEVRGGGGGHASRHIAIESLK